MNHLTRSAISHCLLGLLAMTFFGCQTKATQETTTETATSTTDSLVYDTGPRWSKSGDKILFYTYRHDKEGAELYTVRPDGSELTRLTDTYHNEWWSDFSQGDSIIFISSDFGKSERFGGSEIFALSAEGTMTQLTNHEDSTSFNIAPKVSPDGTQMMYCFNCLGTDVDSEVYLIQTDGTNPVNLTNHPGQDRYGSWSPSGDKIIFESKRNGNMDLYIMDLATKALTQLTQDAGNNRQADWSPDNRIVFISDRDGDDELFVMNVDGSDQQQITFNEDRDVLPSWSPQGTQIVFSSYRFGEKDTGDIFLIDPDGANEVRLTKY